MTVQVRLNRDPTRTRRMRREGRSDHLSPRAEAPSPEPRDKRGGPTQDRAMYTCQCGFVFQATVSTSVGCPHCGDTQAW
jgi:hypothetical protein